MKPTQVHRICAILVALEILSGAAHAGSVVPGDDTFHVPVVSWKALRYSRVVAQQYDFSCGSAAVATLLTFSYDQPTDEQGAFRQMYAHSEQAVIQKVGFSLLDMQRYLASRGYDAEGFMADLDAVDRIGVPVITLITTGSYHHFVVLRGIRGPTVLIADPSLGLRTIPRKDFEKMWTGALLLIRNYAEVGGSHYNDPADWKLVPAPALERAMDQQRKSLGDIFLNLPLANEF